MAEFGDVNETKYLVERMPIGVSIETSLVALVARLNRGTTDGLGVDGRMGRTIRYNHILRGIRSYVLPYGKIERCNNIFCTPGQRR